MGVRCFFDQLVIWREQLLLPYGFQIWLYQSSKIVSPNGFEPFWGLTDKKCPLTNVAQQMNLGRAFHAERTRTRD